MANLKGVDIQRGKIGANRLTANDSISGMIISTIEPTNLKTEQPTRVYNMRDVESLGITKEFDITNNVNVYRHCSEFYEMAGSGTVLHLMIVSQKNKMTSILGAPAKKLLAYARGEIRQLAIAMNPIGKEDTITDGLPSEVFNSIALAQGLYNWAFDNHMPCQILLEGYNYSGNSATVANLRDLKDNNAFKVSIAIGQDWNYADKLKPERQKYADIGTLLGTVSKARVQENIGDNSQFDLTDSTKKRWTEAGLSSHQKNKDVFESLQTLEDKGYIFGITYSGLAGVRWNNDHTATPIILDADNSMNEHTIAYGRVLDKAVRELRIAYLPKVKTTWTVDKKTGKLTKGVLVALADVGDNVFEDMVQRGEITSGKTYIDGDSDLLIEKKLKVDFKIVPKGVIGEINGTINLKTKD